MHFKKVPVKTNLECRLGCPGPQRVNKSGFHLLSSPKVIWHISKAKPYSKGQGAAGVAEVQDPSVLQGSVYSSVASALLTSEHG